MRISGCEMQISSSQKEVVCGCDSNEDHVTCVSSGHKILNKMFWVFSFFLMYESAFAVTSYGSNVCSGCTIMMDQPKPIYRQF